MKEPRSERPRSKMTVSFLPTDCVGAEVEKAVNGLKEGQVLLLENLRLHAEEEKNDEDLQSSWPGYAMYM